MAAAFRTLILAVFCGACALAPAASPERILVEFPVDPERRDEFIAEVNKILVDTRAFEGCLEANVWTHELEPAVVWIYEEWEERADQVAYVKWRADTGNTAHLGEFITGEVRFLWLESH